jgi:UDP-glucose 4-epimerase
MKIMSVPWFMYCRIAEMTEANFIFSSSCTVYGQAEKCRLLKMHRFKSDVSYGNTKQIGEEIITDVAKVSNINAILLRYFNPIGAHPSAEMNYLLEYLKT